MKIVVKEAGGKGLKLSIPTGLLLNRLTAGVVASQMRKHGMQVTRKQASVLIKQLNDFRKSHPEWVLVDAESSDGDSVKFKL